MAETTNFRPIGNGWENWRTRLQFSSLAGPFADVDYEEDSSGKVMSLRIISAAVLVSRGLFNALGDAALIPRNKLLYMDIAINTCNVSCIRFLLQHWIHEDLLFRLPDICRSWRLFALRELCGLARLTASASSILYHFIQFSTALQYVDLSALPILDAQIETVCSLVLENGEDSGPIISMYLNCLFMNRTTMRRFCVTLGMPSRIQLVVKGLHVHIVFIESLLLTLLQLLNPQHLEKFSCRNELCPLFVVQILEELERFTRLKAIALHHHQDIESLKQLLDALVNLERLCLKGSNIRNKLEYCLRDTYNRRYSHPSAEKRPCCGELKYLCLASISSSSFNRSIDYLARSPFSETLLNLDLSFNRFGLRSLASLITSCKNLRCLNLEGCSFTTVDLNPLFEAFSSLENLKYLNARIKLSAEYMMSVAPLLGRIPNILHLWVESPYSPMEHGANWTSFRERFSSAVQSVAPLRTIIIDFGYRYYNCRLLNTSSN